MVPSADDSARTHFHETIIDLIRCRPDDWPEILAKQAGVACGQNTTALSLLADAYRLARETRRR